MADIFCFSCGASTVALGQQVVPICSNCRARGLVGRGPEASWMVRLPNGNSRGPLSRTAVIGWIARGRVGPDDRISPVGGEETALADHPDFRGCFIPGSTDEREVERLREEFQGIEKRAQFRRVVAHVGAVAFLCVAVGVVSVSMNSRMTVLPVPVLEKVEDSLNFIQTLLYSPVDYEPLPVRSEMPHADWANAQGNTDDATAYQRGQALLWVSPNGDTLDVARRHHLAAIAQSPTDSMAHAGLLEVNSEMLSARPDLIGEIARVAVRLESLRADGPGVDRAFGALALAKGNRLGALEATKGCQQRDLGCRLIHSEAAENVEALLEIRDEYGPIPRVLRAWGRTAHTAFDWAQMGLASNEMIQTLSTDTQGFQLRAEYHAGLGYWDEAFLAAQKARQLGSENPATLHLEAAILVHLHGDHERGLQLYRVLSENPLLPGYEHRLKVLMQGALAAVRAGDFAMARSMIGAAQDVAGQSAEVMMVQAMVEFFSGEQEQAETLLREIDSAELSRDDEANMHLWSAYIYLDGGKQRLARTELEEAQRLQPSWHRLFHEVIWAELQAKNINNLMDAVTSMTLAPPAQSIRKDPRTTMGLGEPPYRQFAGPLLRAMDADIRYERLREPVAAILGWTSRRPGALTHMLETNESVPDNLALQAAMAAAHFEAGNWDEAVANSLEVVSRMPSAKWMQCIRGRALAKLGKWNEAKDALRRSSRGDVSDIRYLQWAAEGWSQNGDTEGARLLLEQAAEREPDDVIIRRGLLALAGGSE